MRTGTQRVGVLAALWAAQSFAAADVTYLTQDRSIAILTSFDQFTDSRFAPDFGPFVENITHSTMFPTPDGGTGVNAAASGIDCQLDPNDIVVGGSLSGQGGISDSGGDTNVEFGEAEARVTVSFRVDEATPFLLLALPRPSTNPDDRFKIKLEDLTREITLFLLEQDAPAQDVNFGGVLAPGVYSLEYQLELTVTAEESTKAFGLSLSVPAPGSSLVSLAAAAVCARRGRRVPIIPRA